MKKFIYFFLFNFLIFSLFAQNPNSKGIAIEYLQYPNISLESNVKSYWLTVATNGASEYQVPIEYGGPFFKSLKESAKSTLAMAITGSKPEQLGLQVLELDRLGFKKSLSMGDADLQLYFLINSISNKGRVNTLKNTSSTAEAQPEIWNYTVESTMNFTTRIEDSKNNRVFIINENQATSKESTSENYNSYKVAEKAFKDFRGVVSKKHSDEMLQANYYVFRKGLVNELGYIKTKYNMAFIRGKGGKFDYSDLSNAFEDMKSVNMILKDVFKDKAKRYENLTDPIKIELNGKLDNCIKIWENAIKEYIPKTKKTRIGDKIIDHLYLNLSAAYFLKDNWSKASKLLKEISVRKSEIKKAEDFKKLINRTSLARDGQQ
tara:strand:- start:9073 stop:10200 length:1128 start_codon:yes stop_codon:yes gene_type:complete